MIDYDKHHRAAFVFRYDKSLGRLTPITRRLVVFEHGRGDEATLASPYLRAGYVDACEEITDVGRLGAIADGEVAALLSVVLTDDLQPRVVPCGEAIEHRGGIAVPWRRDHHATLRYEEDSLGRAVLHDPYVTMLAPTDCVPAERNDACVCTGVLRSGMFVEPPRAMASVGTNRISIAWDRPFSVVVSPLGIDAGDGDLVVLDLGVRVSFAAVRFSDDGQDYDGITDADREKIAAWRVTIASP